MNRPTPRLFAWVLYDFACSAFSTLIVTFVFATYFADRVAANPTLGAEQWGLAMGVSGLFIVLGAPFLGTVADQGGDGKFWLILFSLLTIVCTGLLYFIYPSSQYVLPALLLASGGTAALEFAYIFYNAMLPEVATKETVGRWSGWGWSMGYLGGILSLALCLLLFIGSHALIPLNKATGQDVRATFILAALWFALFALPLFLFAPQDRGKKMAFHQLARKSLAQLAQLYQQFASYRPLFYFFIARMLYNDALLTLFAFGGVYAASQFQMSSEKILYFGLALNSTAGIGAASFALLDDKIGGKWTVVISLIGLIVMGTFALLARNESQFWIAALLLGLFVGPAQASSRSYLARLASPNERQQMFGLFALSARVSQFMGPLLVSWLTYLTDSLRIGMGAIIVLLTVGLLLMLGVQSDKRAP